MKQPEGHPIGCRCNPCINIPKESKEMRAEAAERAGQRILFEKAKKGDAMAARDLLKARRDYEYEGWTFEEVTSAPPAQYQRVWGAKKPCNAALVSKDGIVQMTFHGSVQFRVYSTGAAALKDLRGRKFKSALAVKETVTGGDWVLAKITAQEPAQEDRAVALRAAPGLYSSGKCIRLVMQWCSTHRAEVAPFET